MVLKLYMMYILYLNHGEELKAKALPLIWCFMYRRLKIDVDGYNASQAQYILRYHVNMQFNKIPTTSYALQQKRWGHDLTRNRKGS